MTAGECSGGAFACSLGIFHHLVENALFITRTWQAVLTEIEMVVHIGEYSLGNVAEPHGLVIESGPHHGHKHKDDIIDEERGDDDKCRTFKLLIAESKIIEHHEGYHGIIGSIAHVHQFADNGRGKCLAEQQGRLTAEEGLLPSGKQVVEVGQHAVDFVSVGIPPAQ